MPKWRHRFIVLTADQVLSLAPDPASAKAGQQLASPQKWASLGTDGAGLWGECKGSGASPYRVTVELATTGYACSCPSRKFPCKHVIALLLMSANGNVPANETPAWFAAWLEARQKKAEAKAAAPARASKPVDPGAQAAAAAKRAATREKRVADGIDELELWMRDLVRLGLASVQRSPASFWDTKAARLVDAQAPGLASRVRALRGITASGSGWESRLLDALGSLYLLCSAYRRIDSLEPRRRADVRRYIGWTQREEEVVEAAGGGVDDEWHVIGVRAEMDGNLLAHRTWLRGASSGRPALVLQFAGNGFELKANFAAGTAFRGKLAYFESAVPMRAAIVERENTLAQIAAPPAATIDETYAAYAEAVARDPWFETLPACIAAGATAFARDEWHVLDANERAMPLSKKYEAPYALHALCGGRPMVVSGEWNGSVFNPLAVWSDGRFVALQG